ncbi:double-strand break repair protein [Thraustotheca clavata]|uniref:Double-strand break repair protein n=1 Tax=Thraustotheca clavata TaxID=74557 RepID=A0A1W0A3D3_9STRA|nr:double-strand break repair protein [Thraustotheca clavata]
MADTASTIKILVSTDNHLGYCENDGVRGKDSFRAFEEMLSIGVREKVDFVLLAGDLFHHNKPSRATLYRTMALLRNYCLGDGSINFQILSDQSLNFPNFGHANYEDPNINVRLPIFSIHGNHDDPTGEAGRSLAALDLLSAANLVNYFGKSDRVDEIEVFPILLEKGSTKLAVYGLGNMRDERLHRMFAQGKVRFRRPEDTPEEWFSIFVVHQNRDNRGRGAKNCLPESFIPDFIDFVIWGHEHECLIELEESLKANFFITQPGSSIATSLIEGESKPKKVGILEVLGGNFRLRSIPLNTVRPFKMGEVVLKDVDGLDPNDPKVADKIHSVLTVRVQELIDQAKAEMNEANTRSSEEIESTEILIRLRVEHSGFPVINNQRFGGQFVGRVANPSDILLFTRRKEDAKSNKEDKKQIGGLLAPIRPPPPSDAVVRVEQILSETLDNAENKLDIFPEVNMANALDEYVFKNVPSAFEEFVDSVLEETQRALKQSKSTITKAEIQALVEKNVERVRANLAVSTIEDSTARTIQLLSSTSSQANDTSNAKLSDEEQIAPKPTSSSKKRSQYAELSDSDASVEIAVPKKKAPAARKPRASSKRKQVDSDEEAPAPKKPRKQPAKSTKATERKKAKMTPSKGRFEEIAIEDSDDDAMIQPSAQTSQLPSQTRRKLPLSFGTFTQDAEPTPSASTLAKGWGRMRK